MCDGFRLTKCSLKLVLSFHADIVNGMEALVQLYLRVKGRARLLQVRSRIIGVRTDFISAGAVVNAIVKCSCDGIARLSEELMDIISALI